MTIQVHLESLTKHSLRKGLMTSCIAMAGFAAPAHAGYTIVKFDPPDSTSTLVTGINDSGAVTGYYGQSVDRLAMPLGFARSPGGAITTFAPSGSKATFAEAIDTDGAIAGYFTDTSTGAQRGFVRAAASLAPGLNAITAFDAAYIPRLVVSTYAWSIDGGEIAGSYTADGVSYHGYLREADGTVYRFDPPNSVSTWALGVSNGAVTGYYFDGTTDHCFVRAANGTILTFDPGASLDTKCYAINATGSIAGYFAHTDGEGTLGFVRSPKGAFTVFDGRRDIGSTYGWSINERAAVAGSWYDRKGEAHGLAADRDGKVELFDPYGSTGTFATAVNSKHSIAGYWTDSSGIEHGFVRVRSIQNSPSRIESAGSGPSASGHGPVRDPLLPRNHTGGSDNAPSASGQGPVRDPLLPRNHTGGSDNAPSASGQGPVRDPLLPRNHTGGTNNGPTASGQGPVRDPLLPKKAS